MISQCVARAIRRVYSTTLRLSTGSTPGMPRQTGQVCVLGGDPKAVEQLQKIFVLVFSWACTSSPMTGSNSILAPEIDGDGRCHTEHTVRSDL